MRELSWLRSLRPEPLNLKATKRRTVREEAQMPREVRFDYAGARVLVTGGSNGIGLAIAEAYGISGADVSITGTASQKSDYPHDLSGFKYHSVDMRDGTAVDE